MINKLCKEAHDTAVEKGWYEKEVTIPEFISNIHGEISEAFNEYANHRSLTEIIYNPSVRFKKPVGLPIEIADTCIRIFDMCAYLGIDLEEAIRLKMEYNKTRSYRHGDKKV